MFTAAPGCAKIGIDARIVLHTCTPLFTAVETGLSSNCRQQRFFPLALTRVSAIADRISNCPHTVSCPRPPPFVFDVTP
jgi:hypothetical protein